MVYYGFWFVPKMDALMAFSKSVEEPVTGEVNLGLYKGNVFVRGRTSPNSLYDAAVASMEGGGSYNQTDAEGFSLIFCTNHGCASNGGFNPSEEMICLVEARFPFWRSYRDLIDCIDCTLHELRK